MRPGVDEVSAFAKILDEKKSLNANLGKKATNFEDQSGDESLTGESLMKQTFMI